MTTEDNRTGDQVIAQALATLAEADCVIGKTAEELAELLFRYVESATKQLRESPPNWGKIPADVGKDNFRRLVVHTLAQRLDAWRKDA